MRIRRADPEEASTLSGIAWVAKAHWGYPAHWMEEWRDSLAVREERISADEYLVACSDDGQPVGFCAVSGAPGAEWWLKHLWVLPAWQGRGIGRRLFQAAAAHVREWEGAWFDLHADPNAEGFYLRLGAVRIGELDATMNDVPRVLPKLRYVIV